MITHKQSHTHTHTLPAFNLDIPIFAKLYEFYKQLDQYLILFPKNKRYTLGQRIDSLTLEIFEYVIKAGYSSRELKLPIITKAITLVDLLKILIRLAYDIKALDSKKYLLLQQNLQEIGRMLGGWKKSV